MRFADEKVAPTVGCFVIDNRGDIGFSLMSVPKKGLATVISHEQSSRFLRSLSIYEDTWVG